MAKAGASQWVIEHGIGENRALLIQNDIVLAAKLHWPGTPNPGCLFEAKVISLQSGSRRGIARLDDGHDVQLDNIPADITEGMHVYLTIIRAPIAEKGRLKQAIGRIEDRRGLEERYVDLSNRDDGFQLPMLGVDKARQLALGQTHDERWDDIWHAASAGQIDFAGGSIIISTTPAMTVIDVDGHLSPRELALSAVPAITKAIYWFDLGGNIGIDFPTLQAKKDRKAVDAALGAALNDWAHERTAMNGFGFVQIVARLEGPSLLHRFSASRAGACARMALRRGELAQGNGRILLLRIHPALKAKLKEAWLDELGRRTGKKVRIETDPALALESSSAQLVES